MRHRILLIDFTSSFGGAFEHALTLSRVLAKNERFEVALASAQSATALGEHGTLGFQYYPLKPYHKVRSPLQIPGRIGRVVNVLCDIIGGEIPRTISILNIARRFNPSIIYLNNLVNIQQSGVVAAKLRGDKCIFCHQDFEYRSRLALFINQYVDHHIAISTAMRDHLLELGVDAGKITVIYHGIDPERFSPGVGAVDLSANYGIPKDRKVFAIFGRLVPWKGHELFLEIAQQALRRDRNIHGLIVGDTSDGDPAYEAYLKQRASELRIADRVTFVGYSPETPRYMNAVSVVLHLSTRPEPFGLVVAEAMSCGRAVIAMDEGGPVDIVENGVSGILVPPRNVEAATNALCALLVDEKRIEAIGTAARERVLKMFSAEVCARQYIDLCDRVIEESDSVAKGRESNRKQVT